MLTFPTRHVVAVGEAMLEMAPVGDGMYRRGYAGDTFNTSWRMVRLLDENATVGFVTRIGSDKLSEIFAAEMSAGGLDISGVGAAAAPASVSPHQTAEVSRRLAASLRA